MRSSYPKFASKALLSLAASIGAAQFAHAQSDYSLKIGPARIVFDESANFNVAGTPLTGANATVSDRTTLAFELTYRLSEALSAALTFGLTPTSTVSGSGSLSASGELGRVTYAPAVVSLQYAFSPLSGLKPYLGLGAVYFLATDTKDGAVQQLKVDNRFGASLQAGASLPIAKGISIFADVKKFYLKTRATGNVPALGGAPVSADVRLNPLVFQAGLGFDF